MRRLTLARTVAAALTADDIVICSLGSAGRAWREAAAPNLTYYASDPMGMAPSLALGFALARPGDRVTLIEGDGDLAMNLGVLAAIAGAAPPNLRVVVFANGRYETGGGQTLAGRLDLAAAAKACGWERAESPPEDAGEADVADAVRRMYAAGGPAMVVQAVEPEASPYPEAGRWSQAEDKAVFQRELAAREQLGGRS
ncbi:thiamine pyrophosphate-dependent enzyme [Spirillospora sp. NPDC048819]|uniref:thiamine pyrophosphate-dependent enzyme n=1 Tax=Spirillospora sp. NPDC048819 TaxID=3155268 RepID=UPI0033D77618